MNIDLVFIASGVAAIAASTLIAARICRNAPLGYEDENGFHYERVATEAFTPPAPANNNTPPLSDDVKAVLGFMSDEQGIRASTIARWAVMPLKDVRAAQRKLRAEGLAEFGPLFDEYHGKLAGRGYWLTRAGVAERKRLFGAAAA